MGFLLWRGQRRLRRFLRDGERLVDWDVVNLVVPPSGTARVYITTAGLHFLALSDRRTVFSVYFDTLASAQETPERYAFVSQQGSVVEFRAERGFRRGFLEALRTSV